MSATFRPATDDERAGAIRSQWLSRALPKKGERTRQGHPLGRPGHYVSHGLARRSIEILVDSLLSEAEVLVAEVSTSAGPEVIGWAAYDPNDGVYFVCVPSGYGRRGVGTALLARVERDHPGLEHLWRTPAGRALARRGAAGQPEPTACTEATA